MGRMPRIQVDNAVYYILSGGDDSKAIFNDTEDCATYLELLSQYKSIYKFKLFAYCLVPGTVSLLIEPAPRSAISRVMHDINSKYTKYFNRKYAKSGHLFQERYRMVLIEKVSKLLEMTAYVNLRPKLQIPAYDINTYLYSSYAAYIKEGGIEGMPDIGDDVREVLSCLKGNTYQEIVAGVALNKLYILDKELSTMQIIGSDDFIERVKSLMKIGKKKGSDVPAPVPVPRLKPEPEPEPAPEPEAEPDEQPEPDLEKVLAPVPEPQHPTDTAPVPDTIKTVEPKPEPISHEPAPAPDLTVAARPRSNKAIYVITAVFMIFIVSGTFAFLYIKSAQMKAYVNDELSKKDVELKKRLEIERNTLTKSLTDKYETEKSAYEDASRRLQVEKEAYRQAAERIEAEKRSYQEMASRFSNESAHYQKMAERLANEKKRMEEELASMRNAVPEQK